MNHSPALLGSLLACTPHASNGTERRTPNSSSTSFRTHARNWVWLSFLVVVGSFGSALPSRSQSNLVPVSGSDLPNVVVYTNNFEQPVGAEWSRTNRAVTPLGHRSFLGEFWNDAVELSLVALPSHTSARVSFDLFAIRSWDGNGDYCCGGEFWDLRQANQEALVQTTFSTTGPSGNRQSFPGRLTEDDYPAGTGASETNSLGFGYPLANSPIRDAVYHLSVPFAHTSDALNLVFSGHQLQSLTNESWGLDNVVVEIGNETLPLPSAVTYLTEPRSRWRYLDTGANPGDSWTSPNFDDHTWKSGLAELGYGNDNATEQRPAETVVSFGPNSNSKYITTYFRQTFLASNVWAITALNGGLMRDDGAVVYLNGKEVFRSNMPSGAVGPQTLAATTLDGADEFAYVPFQIPVSSLVEGPNTLAVEIHQAAVTSTDISFDLFLRASLSDCDPRFLPTSFSAGVVEFEGADRDVSEEESAIALRLGRFQGSLGTLTVAFNTIEDTARANLDFVPVSGTVTFSEGELTKTIVIPILNDFETEADESFLVRLLSADGNGALGPCTNLTVHIHDDDGYLQFQRTNYVVAESEASIPVTVNWTGSTNRTVTVRVSTSDGTAKGVGADYQNFSEIINFAPGESSKTISIQLHGDFTPEGDEFFNLDLSAASPGAALNARSHATIQILDDDTPTKPGPGPNGQIHTLVEQADHRILIGGEFTQVEGHDISRIARLNSDGSFDPTFQGAGADGTVESIFLHPNGTIWVGGSFTKLNGLARSRLAGLKSNGELDSRFNPSPNGGVYRMMLTQTSKVWVLGGFTTIAGKSAPRIARLTSEGALDPTFNSGQGPGSDVFSLVELPDGRILISGAFTDVNKTPRSHIACLTASGALDNLFTIGTGLSLRANVMKLQSDGRILIAGRFGTVQGVNRNRIARLMADGSLDTSFTPGTGPDGDIQDIALTADGKILVAGVFANWNGAYHSSVVRLFSNGTLDTSFKIGPGGDDSVFAMAVLSDSRIAVGGDFQVLNGFVRNRFSILEAAGNPIPDLLHWIKWSSNEGGNDHFYTLTSRADSWTRSETEAKTLGTHLASINTPSEQTFIERTYLHGVNALRPFWIGFTDSAKEGTYLWSNGDPTLYTHWQRGEPNNAGSGEDFTALNWTYARYGGDLQVGTFGAWNDTPDAGILSHALWMAPYFGIIEKDSPPSHPSILSASGSQIVLPGDSITLKVEATGVGALKYQWVKNDQPLDQANQPSLVIAAASHQDTARYRVVVQDDSASLTSDSISLVVTPPIQIDPTTFQYTPGQGYGLTLSTTPGVQLALESSEDLVHWTLVQSIAGNGNSWKIQTADPGALHLFLRVRVVLP